jgi:hypothetical protein
MCLDRLSKVKYTSPRHVDLCITAAILPLNGCVWNLAGSSYNLRSPGSHISKISISNKANLGGRTNSSTENKLDFVRYTNLVQLYLRIPCLMTQQYLNSRRAQQDGISNAVVKTTINSLPAINSLKMRMHPFIASDAHKQNKQTPWPLVRERTIPTDRPPLVDEI